MIQTIPLIQYLKWTIEVEYNGHKILYYLITKSFVTTYNQSINQFYFANDRTKTGKWVVKIQITRVKINQLRLREQLEIQTIQPN